VIEPPGNIARMASMGRFVRREPPFDRRDKMLHELVGFQAAELRDADAVGIADAREVVRRNRSTIITFSAPVFRARSVRRRKRSATA